MVVKMNFCGLWMTHLGDMEKSAPVPLTKVDVYVHIVDLMAVVKIKQTHKNISSQPIETKYTFPLKEGAVVSQFTADIDGRKITEVIKETSGAQADYLMDIRREQATAMVQEENADVFTTEVGNLAASKRANIKLTYKTELKVVNGEIRFFLPITISPCYIPVEKKSSWKPTLASTNYAGISDYELTFEAEITMASAIIGIRSPTHQISTSTFNNGSKATVILSAIVASTDRNLVLYINVDKPFKSRWILQLDRIREAKQMLDTSLASTNLSAAPIYFNGESYLKGENDLLKELIDDLPSLGVCNKEIMFATERLLKEEHELNDQLEAQFKDRWNRIPSFKLFKVFTQNIGLMTSAETFRAIIESASAADVLIRTKFETQLENLHFQIVQQIQELNEDLVRDDESGGKYSPTRKALSKELTTAHSFAMNLCNNLEEELKFYNDLTELVLDLQFKISSFYLDRINEKEKLLKVLSSSFSPQAVYRGRQKTTNPPGYYSFQTGQTAEPAASDHHTRSSSFPDEKEELLKELSSFVTSKGGHQVSQKTTNPSGYTGQTGVSPTPPPLPPTRPSAQIKKFVPVQQRSSAKWNETLIKDIKSARTNGLSLRRTSSVAVAPKKTIITLNGSSTMLNKPQRCASSLAKNHSGVEEDLISRARLCVSNVRPANINRFLS